MFRSVLIVVLSAIFGSALGLSSWLVAMSVQQDDLDLWLALTADELRAFGIFLLMTLVFTMPGAAYLLGVRKVLEATSYSARAQSAAILLAGFVAGAAILAAPSIIMRDFPEWRDVLIGAWFGLCTAVVFVAFSRTTSLIARAER